jgi:hypothetical protein
MYEIRHVFICKAHQTSTVGMNGCTPCAGPNGLAKPSRNAVEQGEEQVQKHAGNPCKTQELAHKGTRA